MKIGNIITGLILIFTFNVNGQNIEGEWRIDHLMIDTLVKDYTLDTLSSERYSNYGNHISINKDGSFRTWYTAPCGNDCFISSFGKYNLIDSTHIQFSIEKVNFIKAECNGRTSPYTFPLDIGFFHLDIQNNQVHLVKINTILE